MDQRGVSEVLGFVLAFSLTVTTFAIYQADVIPHQNQETEFEHSQSMGAELEELRNAIDRGGVAGVADSESVATGVSYPKRALGINPPTVKGRLWTSESYDVRLHGLESPGSSSYWTGGTKTFETRLLHYQANYHVYHEEPVFAIENGMVTKRFDGGTIITTSEGTLVSGNQVSLTLLKGSYRESGQSTVTDVEPISSGRAYTALTASGGNPRIVLPTLLSQAEWTDYASDHPKIQAVTVTPAYGTGPVQQVAIELVPGETYRVRLAAVGLETQGSTSVEYLTTSGPTSRSLDVGEAEAFTVTARDEYGNPVSGATLDATVVSGGGTLVPTSGTVTTDADGSARIDFEPNVATPAEVRVSVQGAPSKRIEFDLGSSGRMTVTSPNQQFTGLGAVDSITVGNGRQVTTTDEPCALDVDVGGLTCTERTYDLLSADLNFADSDGETYRVRVVLADFNRDGDVSDTAGFGQPADVRQLVITRDGTELYDGTLTTSAANDVLSGGSVDLLDDDSVESGDPGDGVDIDDSDLLVNDVRGRIEVETDD